jgi:type II secretion system protein I
VIARAPRRQGLSLIEVLLALAIFLMSLVVIARLVDMGTDREMEARFQNRGSRLAQAKLAEIESGASSLDATEGQFDGDDSAWSWTMSAEQQTAPSLYLVTVTVTRDVKGQPFTVTLSQMVLDPTVFGTAGEAARPDTGASGGNAP